MVGDVFQTVQDDLAASVPKGCRVVTPDAVRIGGRLEEIFGAAYSGGDIPSAEGLARFFLAEPSALKDEPLPVYLNPAVCDPN